ncbi:Syndecan [Strongyloides ratti]|uniref:Syndecan n=1 Tax=Strongyloides ratti TaxID=34506 RepID=A0A090KU71_STRRB|nr:Syndecan [Strongyloides ratti]CEF60966.1 Syndecan [Strongyloides ratti]
MNKYFFLIILLLITVLSVFGEIKNENGLNKKAALSGKYNDIEIEGSGKDTYNNNVNDKKIGPNIDMEVESSAISTDDEDGDVVEEGSGYVPPQETNKKVSISSVPITHDEEDIRNTSKNIDSFITSSTHIPVIITTSQQSSIKDIHVEESTKKVDTTTEKLPKDIIHEIHPDDNDDNDMDDSDDDDDTEDDIKIENILVEDPIQEISTKPTTTTTSVVTEKPYVKTSGTSRPDIKTTKTPVIYDDIEQFFASIHILTKPGFLAVIVGGLVIGILVVILFIMFIIYRMRKKDEGSYALDEPSQPPHYSYAYQKAPTKEFYA